MQIKHRLVIAILLFSLPASKTLADRLVIPLDGTWGVGESVGADNLPERFPHAVVVPGLVSQAKPPFADVNQYATLGRMKGWSDLGLRGFNPEDEGPLKGLGRTRQKRDYFWYQRTFALPALRGRAVLVVNQAQFGTAVWLNGKKVGEHLGCASAGIFDVTEAIAWAGENRLVIRIGAHPGALPDWAVAGADLGRVHWAPGIYDSVSLQLADAPMIEAIQVAPRIASSEIVVQTRLKNSGRARTAELVQQVKTWKRQQPVGEPIRLKLSLAADEERVVTQTIPVPNATLWNTENPFLYVVETSTGGDNCTTRFGMREFRCDTATRRSYLNGKVCFLRGASFELPRFFGDPKCGNLPWDETWVRKFLVELPRIMNWNCFRAALGALPQQWLDIADEGGILLQYEFPVWATQQRYERWNKEDVIAQFREFMRDNWNHPSVVIWDASNETNWKFLGEKLIPAVRGLDLSHRPWENSYNLAQGPDDPYEDHPYLFSNPRFRMRDLEQMNGANNAKQSDGANKAVHAAIINEYDWIWLRRDGTPTLLSQENFNRLLGPEATSGQRQALVGYLMGGLTEYWRAYRQFAGVLFYTYLGLDDPRANTCDFFSDVQRLSLEPHFADYMGEAFKPLGIYVNFWQPKLPAGHLRRYRVMLVNDEQQAANGKLELAWHPEDGGERGPAVAKSFSVSPVGQMTCDIELTAPTTPGNYVLTAKAFWDGKPWSPTIARRKVQIIPPSTSKQTP